MTATNGKVTRRTFSGLAAGAVATSALGITTGSSGAQSAPDVSTLEKALGRKVVTPASGGDYDNARFIWNGLFDRKPAIIAPCESAQDVSQCIGFARKNKLAISVRSGGHHPAGFAMNNGGLVIDLSKMKDIKVDAEKRRVIAQPGVLIGEMDAATEPHKLVVPSGAVSTIALGGITLGGGEGWFNEFGLTCDNLISAELVLADGRIVRVDKDREPDLYWAIRGGGGNFGVMTSMELQAHPMENVTFGMMFHPLLWCKDVVMQFREYALNASPDFAGKCIFVRNPAPVMLLASKTTRPMDEAQAELAKLRAFSPPVREMAKPMSLTQLQLVAGGGDVSGARYYAQTHYFNDISSEVVDLVLDAINSAQTNEAGMVIHSQGSGIGKIAVDATPYPHRSARFAIQAQAHWTDAKDDERNIAWVKDWWRATLPMANGGVYANYISEASDDMSKRAYGPNYARLSQIKKRYDPDNVFSSAINIKPA